MMEIILWRHAQAEEGTPDIERPLTPQGRKQAARMGALLDRCLPNSCRILCSPAVRTRQTADALGRKYKVVTEIGPDATPQQVLDAVGWPEGRGQVLVVGHQPWLGQVAALLMSGHLQDWTVKKANAWWIAQRDREEGNVIYLKAVFTPEFFSE